jgi:hypothetical protein
MPNVTSIDINRLIAQGHYKSFATVQPTPLPTLPSDIQKLFLPFFKGGAEIRLTTNFSQEQDPNSLTFLLKFSKETFELHEEKQSKTRRFELNLVHTFLKFNQRRAMNDDFQIFANRLKVLGVMLQKMPLLWWTKFETPPDSQPSLTLKLPKELDVPDKTAYIACEEESKMLSAEAAPILLKLSRLLSQPPSPQQATATQTKDLSADLEVIKNHLLDILSDSMQQTVITNSERIDPNLNTLYTLTISPQKTTFVEKSATLKNSVDFDMKTLDITLNEVAFTAATLEWFIQKLEKIGQDLDSNRADMYKPSSSDIITTK